MAWLFHLLQKILSARPPHVCRHGNARCSADDVCVDCWYDGQI